MAKTATLSLRIEPSLKTGAEKLYKSFGMTISDAVTIFLHKSLKQIFFLKKIVYAMRTGDLKCIKIML